MNLGVKNNNEHSHTLPFATSLYPCRVTLPPQKRNPHLYNAAVPILYESPTSMCHIILRVVVLQRDLFRSHVEDTCLDVLIRNHVRVPRKPLSNPRNWQSNPARRTLRRRSLRSSVIARVFGGLPVRGGRGRAAGQGAGHECGGGRVGRTVGDLQEK